CHLENFKLPCDCFRRGDRLSPAQRLCGESGLDSADPGFGSIIELKIRRHQATTCNQDSEIGALVAVIVRSADAEKEGLSLALDCAAVVVEAIVDDAAVVAQMPDTGLRRRRQDVDAVLSVLNHHLAPTVDVVGIGPALVELVDLELEFDPGEFEEVEEE